MTDIIEFVFEVGLELLEIIVEFWVHKKQNKKTKEINKGTRKKIRISRNAHE